MRRQQLKHMVIAIAALTVLGVATRSALIGLGGGEAHAVVGAPEPTANYAGVARRTVRRSAYTGAAATTAFAAGSAMVATLPGGCTNAAGIYTCNGVRYRAYYDGPTVVYEVVE